MGEGGRGRGEKGGEGLKPKAQSPSSLTPFTSSHFYDISDISPSMTCTSHLTHVHVTFHGRKGQCGPGDELQVYEWIDLFVVWNLRKGKNIDFRFIHVAYKTPKFLARPLVA